MPLIKVYPRINLCPRINSEKNASIIGVEKLTLGGIQSNYRRVSEHLSSGEIEAS